MGWGCIALSIGCAAGMLVLAGCSDSPPASPATCHLSALAEFPVTITGDDHFLIPATINGKDTKLILDTGAFESALFDSSLKRLGVKYSSFSLEGRATGLGGFADVGVASLDGLKLGDVSYGSLDMPVIVPDESTRDAQLESNKKIKFDESGVVGNNFLSHFDIEFDLSENKIIILSQDHCRGQVQHWTGVLISTPFQMTTPEYDMKTDEIVRRGPDDYRIEVPIVVNGKTIAAVLDSGSKNNYMTWRFARQLGISKDTPGVTRAGVVYGVDGHPIPIYRYVFSAFAIGDETLVGVPVKIGDVPERVNGGYSDIFLLGADFLKNNRVYIAYRERMIYFTPYDFKYSDGTVGK